jgi:hypothetical protein
MTGTATTAIAPQNATEAVPGRRRRHAGSKPRPRAVHHVTTATATVASAVSEVTVASAEIAVSAATGERLRRAATRRRARATKADARSKAAVPATEKTENPS